MAVLFEEDGLQEVEYDGLVGSDEGRCDDYEKEYIGQGFGFSFCRRFAAVKGCDGFHFRRCSNQRAHGM